MVSKKKLKTRAFWYWMVFTLQLVYAESINKSCGKTIKNLYYYKMY